jgi:sigma-B regulation protein RsbU (phosphoserine phosphatase)
MAKVARDVCDETAPGDFVTVFYGVLDCRTRTLTYTNGGHCPPLLFHNGKVQPLGTGGPLVGINWNERYPLDTVSLMPGDLLVAYTDGISEATCPAGELFGQARMEQAIWTSVRHGDEAEAVTRRLYAEARQFVSAEGELDDIAVVSIRVLPARPA